MARRRAPRLALDAKTGLPTTIIDVMKFVVTIDRDEDGAFVAECPAIPGCISQGKSEAEALTNIEDAIRECLEVRAELGMPLTVAVHQVEIGV